MAKKLKQNIQPVDGLMISNFDVTLYNKQGYFDILVAVKDRARADALVKWWPWKATVDANKSTGLKKDRVAVHLVQGAEDTVYWVWNSALAARMCAVWEQARRKNRAYFRDYTLSCLCGGTVMVGDSAGQIKCKGCGQFPKFKRYTGPWNPPGFREPATAKTAKPPVTKLVTKLPGQTPQKKLPGKRAKSPGSWQTLL